MPSNIKDLRRGFRLGPWTVEPLRGSVEGPGGSSHLEPKVMDVFLQLADRPNRLLTRAQLLDSVWGGEAAADELLTRAVSEIRRALHDDPHAPRYIQTVPKRGYRLIGQVQPASGAATADQDRAPVSRPGTRIVAAAAVALAVGFGYLGLLELGSGRVDDGRLPEPGAGSPSIAVLPFVNMTADPAMDYLADGLPEEVRNLLSRIPNLRVIGRTSSYAVQGEDQDLREIGRTLGVQSVLEGSLRGSGDRLRISAQLIDTADGAQIWSKSYDRTVTDLFELQDDVAAGIIDALRMHIDTNPTRGRPTEVPEAYGLFLKARTAMNVQDLKAVLSDLSRALELDPEFAEAHELLAHAYWTRFSPEFSVEETHILMRDAAARALEIDPELPVARALERLGRSDKPVDPEALEAFRAAARERPNDPMILRTLTWDLAMTGYLDEALEFARQWVSVDPLSSIAHIRYCAVLRAVGRVEDSLAALEVAQSLTPGSLDWYFGETYLAQRRYADAIPHFQAYVEHAGQGDPAWVADLVDRARDPVQGQAYLEQNIPLIAQMVQPAQPTDFRQALERWYLFLGHLDPYFEIILGMVSGDEYPGVADMHLWYGTLYRDLGFTAHPRYLEAAAKMGFIDVWEQRGPPDFCSRSGGEWTCR